MIADMNRRIFLWALTVSIMLAIGIVVSAAFFPYVRIVAINSGVAKHVITAYNAVRPTLNFGNNEACLKSLKGLAVKFDPVADWATTEGCFVENSVKVSSIGGVRLSPPAIMTCRMVSLLGKFAENVLRPAAQDLGTAVAVINHVGTYNCRPMRRLNNLLSEHAFANAIDITGFRFEDGQSITLIKGWGRGDDLSRFLHRVGEEACGVFPLALTPNHNALHKDHFHLDAGVWPQCGY
jgi:hypothetical protein